LTTFFGCDSVVMNYNGEPDSLEKLILSGMIDELSTFTMVDEYRLMITDAVEIYENPKATAEEISNAVNQLIFLKNEIVNKRIIFSDSAFEKKLIKILNKTQDSTYLTINDTINIRELDLSYNNDISDVDYMILKLDDLKNFPNLQKLIISGNNVISLNPILQLKELIYLDLNGIVSADLVSVGQNIDFSVLSELSELVDLNISNNNINSLSMINNLINLHTLKINNNPINDFSGIEQLKSLENIEMKYMNYINFISLEKLGNLKKLDCSFSNLDNITEIFSLDRLISLNLSGIQMINIVDLNKMNQLEELFLSKCGLIDVSFLSQFKELKIVDISENEIFDIEFLSELKNLTNINMSFNKIERLNLNNYPVLENLTINNNLLQGIGFLTNLPILKSVDLANNQLTYLELNGSTNITELNLNKNSISDLTFIKNLDRLNILIADNNPINTIVLQNLPKLNYLSLKGTNIKDVSSVYEMSSLIYLDISDCRNTNIDGIENLANLEQLYINLNKSPTNFELSALVKLKNLEIYNMQNDDWFIFNNMEELVDLKFFDCEFISANLFGLNKLQSVEFYNCSSLSDISQITELPLLENLYVERARIIRPLLANLSGLRRLSLVSSKVEEIQGISQLPELEYLNLYNNELAAVQLNDFPKLVELDLSKNLFVNFSKFKMNFNGKLDLSSNYINKLDGIENIFAKLDTLNLSKNKINNFTPIYAIDILNVIADGNRIAYVSPTDDQILAAKNKIEMKLFEIQQSELNKLEEEKIKR